MNDKLDKLLDSWTEEKQLLAINNRFAYIFAKAELFLELGPEEYFAKDALPPKREYPNTTLEALKRGCEQIMQGRGLTSETAFINISVNEFNVFMNMFHFTKIDRKTNHKYVLDKDEGILDKITWQHVVDKTQMENFNFHKKAPRDDDFINELMKDL